MFSRMVKPVVITLAALGLMALVYFLVGVSNSVAIYNTYASLRSDVNESSYPKSLQFLISYTIGSGDTTLALNYGLTEEDIYGMQIVDLGDVGETGDIASEWNDSMRTGDDFIDAARAIAAKFTDTSGSYHYSQLSGSSGTIEFNGLSHSTSHRDCSCFCSAMRYFTGIESNFVHRSSSSFAGLQNTGATTYADVEPGDILVRTGHVAMVVKVEGDTVYIADCGSTNKIQTTAQQGWAYTASRSQSIGSICSNNHDSFSLVVR